MSDPIHRLPEPPQSTEDRLLDLLSSSMDRQVSAIERMETTIGGKLERLDDSVEKLASGLGSTKLVLYGFVFAAVLFSLAQGMDVALSWTQGLDGTVTTAATAAQP